MFFRNVVLFPDQEFSFELNQTLCFYGELPAGPSTSTAGFCVCLPSLDPFIVLQYWFRNKSGWLIQYSTFPNKLAGRSCCVWQAAPHVAVFILSPPLKINEELSDEEGKRLHMNVGNIMLRAKHKTSPTGSIPQLLFSLELCLV